MISFLRRAFGWCHGGSLALAGTVALGYLPSLWRGSVDPTTARGAWCVALGLVYGLFGMVDYAMLGLRESPGRRVLYLGVQGSLLFGILSLSRFSDQIYLCVFPLVVAAVMLLRPVTATLAVTLLLVLTAGMQAYFYGREACAGFATAMVPAFAFVVLFTRIAVREKAGRARAESLASEVERLAVIAERNRLAREIHDSLGHFLTTIHVQLEAARTIHGADPDRALAAVAKAQDLARDALVEVRRSVGALHDDAAPPPLPARLRELIAAADGWGAAVSLAVLGEERSLAPAAAHALFRAAQEGLTNVRKHAGARTARVTLDYREPAQVGVQVVDDGCGSARGQSGRGLAGLQERVASLGGRVEARNQAGGGFALRVEVPA